MISVDFPIKELDVAIEKNAIRELVSARLSKDYSDCGKFFDALVDDLTAVINKLLTARSQEEIASSGRPVPEAPTLYRSRPVWAHRLTLLFHPPQRGGVTGQSFWSEMV